MDVLNATVGIVSLLIGGAAIVVSFLLYRMSESGAQKMRESEQLIHQHVKELDRIFGLLYADTWSLVRDSYNAMHAELRVGSGVDRAAEAEGGPGRPGVDGSRADVSRAAQSNTSDELSDFLVDAHSRAIASGPVSADDLVKAASVAGYAATDALAALYDLTFTRGRLFIAGDEIRPSSILYPDASQASTAWAENRSRALDELGPIGRGSDR